VIKSRPSRSHKGIGNREQGRGFWSNTQSRIGMSAKKPGFYGKFIVLTNGLDEETRFLDCGLTELYGNISKFVRDRITYLNHIYPRKTAVLCAYQVGH
jgi:hypothetical protein